MKRKNLVKIHLIATVISTLCISSFFVSSLITEIYGNEEIIKQVKKAIFFTLPLLILSMAALGMTGNKLGSKSKNPLVLNKQKRMKFIFINGIILIFLASYLYYKAIYHSIDNAFLTFQLVEFFFGLANLTLIGMSIRDGLMLSGKLKRDKKSLSVKRNNIQS